MSQIVQTTAKQWFPTIKMKRSRTRTIPSQSRLTQYTTLGLFKVHCDDHFYLVASKVGYWWSQSTADSDSNVNRWRFELSAYSITIRDFHSEVYFHPGSFYFFLPWSNFMFGFGHRHECRLVFLIRKRIRSCYFFVSVSKFIAAVKVCTKLLRSLVPESERAALS